MTQCLDHWLQGIERIDLSGGSVVVTLLSLIPIVGDRKVSTKMRADISARDESSVDCTRSEGSAARSTCPLGVDGSSTEGARSGFDTSTSPVMCDGAEDSAMGLRRGVAASTSLDKRDEAGDRAERCSRRVAC